MSKDKDTLLKRARAKYLSAQLARKLGQGNRDSPLSYSYRSSLFCTSVMRQEGQKLTATYCKQRWCAVCNRIRTAKAITGYLPVLRTLEDLHFVTLTKKTVKADELPVSIDLMNQTWRKITDTARKKRQFFEGVRKAECTIRPGGLYHYHFHVIVSGKANADWLVGAWLKRMKGNADAKAQDVRPADERSLKEVFKYFTKLTTSNKQGERTLYDYSRMDVIFRAMRGRRVFQPFGGLRIVSEEIEEVNGQDFECLEEAEQVWKWHSEDWINQAGECLTGYRASDGFKRLFEQPQPPEAG
jgi:diadenosine tetraphosphate (Ap4A) HIT family hydrolase